jgi:flagellar basal-body rod protein FlgF
MDRGSYIAATGGVAQLQRLDVVTNNLANVNTPGFKKQVVATQAKEFDQTFAAQFEAQDPFARADHERASGAVVASAQVDFSVGAIRNTGNPLDAAIKHKNSFFAVQTPDGIQYTRAGNFSIDQNGDLVTQEGFPVISEGSAINVGNVPNVFIAEGGYVRSGRTNLGQIITVRIDDLNALVPVGGTRFKAEGVQVTPDEQPPITPRSLESANVSPIQGVVELINANRAFELYTRTASSLDQMNNQAISTVGNRRS